MNAPHDPAQRYDIRFMPAARRAISHRLPELVAAAVLEFCDQALAGADPHVKMQPILDDLALGNALERQLRCHHLRHGRKEAAVERKRREGS